jgi:hypothetical protein
MHESTLKELIQKHGVDVKFSKESWPETDWILFDGIDWIGSAKNIKPDKGNNWILWQAKSFARFWLNVYPKSVLYCETREQAESLKQPGRVAMIKIEVPHGRFE